MSCFTPSYRDPSVTRHTATGFQVFLGRKLHYIYPYLINHCKSKGEKGKKEHAADEIQHHPPAELERHYNGPHGITRDLHCLPKQAIALSDWAVMKTKRGYTVRHQSVVADSIIKLLFHPVQSL